ACFDLPLLPSLQLLVTLVDSGVGGNESSVCAITTLHGPEVVLLDEVMHQVVAEGYQLPEIVLCSGVVVSREHYVHVKTKCKHVVRDVFEHVGRCVGTIRDELRSNELAHQGAKCHAIGFTDPCVPDGLQVAGRSSNVAVRYDCLEQTLVLLQANHAAPEPTLDLELTLLDTVVG